MTTVTFYTKGGLYTGFKASGHAGYGEYGQDIVCAAISALTQATAQGLIEVANVKTDVKTDDQAGLLEVKLKSEQTDTALRDAQILLKTLYLALTALSQEEQYTGNIRLTTKERR